MDSAFHDYFMDQKRSLLLAGFLLVNVLLIALYFLLYRFCSSLLTTATAQAVVFVILFAIFDYLMRMQIKYQLGVNYFKIRDKV